MTFILTAVCVAPHREPWVAEAALVVEPAAQESDSWARAGYLPGLTRYFAAPIGGAAFHILHDEGGGYHSSNCFFQLPDEDDEPARLAIPDQLRGPVERILSELVSASGEGRVILVAEENGHVTSPDLSDLEAQTIDRIGPIDLLTFWRLVDLGELHEDSVILIEAPLP